MLGRGASRSSSGLVTSKSRLLTLSLPRKTSCPSFDRYVTRRIIELVSTRTKQTPTNPPFSVAVAAVEIPTTQLQCKACGQHLLDGCQSMCADYAESPDRMVDDGPEPCPAEKQHPTLENGRAMLQSLSLEPERCILLPRKHGLLFQSAASAPLQPE